jgi:hypothetical protein
VLGVDSLSLALWRAPLSLRKLRAGSAAWLAVYLALATGIFALVGRFIVAHEGHARRAFVAYIFPDRWQDAGHLLVDRLFGAQQHAVLVNAAVGASLLLVQVLLFPVKERLSARFERDAKLVDGADAGHGLPLLVEAREELLLALAFLAAQGSIFWIGYSQDPSRRLLATVLSHAFLMASFGVDFLTPILQRHGHRYATTLALVAGHPVLLLAFGGLFTLPSVLVGRWIAAHPALPLATAITALFAANVLAVAWAAVAGTFAGARLLPEARREKPPGRFTRTLAWTVLVGLLGWNAWRFGAVGLSLHHKSQLLKCEYALDWTSVRLERPGVLELASGLRHDRLQVGVSFDVTISNPTRFDVEIEDNRLELAKDGQRFASTRVTPLAVPAGGRSRVHMQLPVVLTPGQLARGTELLQAEGWTVTLWLAVAPGFELPIYLR